MCAGRSNELSAVVKTRNVKPGVQLLLYARAAGHCQFDDCKRDATAHHITGSQGNFGEKAHIVAFRKRGPRGEIDDRPEDINALENLMLLCPSCHKLADDHPAKYTRELLERMKLAHEDHVRWAMTMRPNLATHVITLQAPIGSRLVTVSDQEVLDAIAPRHPDGPSWTRIDLRALAAQGETRAYYEAAAKQIQSDLRDLHDPNGRFRGVSHFSVLAIGPIPILMELGSRLTDKIAADLYQKHRTPEDWNWRSETTPAEYTFDVVRDHGAEAPVALLLSLSGVIDRDELPADLKDGATLYELTLSSRHPGLTFLNMASDLVRFQDAFLDALSQISGTHGGKTPIHIIPAIPAPVAVACGRARLPKFQGPFLIYDRRQDAGGYEFVWEVSNGDD